MSVAVRLVWHVNIRIRLQKEKTASSINNAKRRNKERRSKPSAATHRRALCYLCHWILNGPQRVFVERTVSDDHSAWTDTPKTEMRSSKLINNEQRFIIQGLAKGTWNAWIDLVSHDACFIFILLCQCPNCDIFKHLFVCLFILLHNDTQ